VDRDLPDEPDPHTAIVALGAEGELGPTISWLGILPR